MHFPAAIFFRFLLALGAWAATPLANAATTAFSYTLNLPCQSNLATPEWLGHPVAPPGTFGSLDLPLTTPESGASLLVTISFGETEGGFLRLTWKNEQGEQVLSANFYQGVGMNNQRTLLVPASVALGAGTFSLQSGDSVLDVQRIHLEWVEERPALVSPERPDEEVVSRLGKAAAATDFDGAPAAAASAMLDGSIVSVPVTSAPQRIEQGVQFNLQLDGTPQTARFSFEESGLPWGRHLVVWINQQRAGTVTPEVPDLQDVGFSTVTGSTYVGWRHGSIYIPAAILKAGLNSVQFSVENDNPPTGDNQEDDSTFDQPLAVNHFVCQFDYSSVSSAPIPSLVSTGTASAQVPGPGSSTDEKVSTPGVTPAADAEVTAPLNPSITTSP